MKKPSELHLDLTDERINTIGRLIARVRLENIESADERDDGWSLGCRAYKWCCSEITSLSATTQWLTIENHTLKYIFKIGGVEVSFYKGEVDNPKKNISSRAQSNPELYQLSLLSDFELPEKLVWTYAVETDAEGLTTNIEFVAMSESGNVIAAHNVPIHNVVSTLYVINTIESEAAILDAAPVSLTGHAKVQSVIDKTNEK
jgi:hypothetical protein